MCIIENVSARSAADCILLPRHTVRCIVHIVVLITFKAMYNTCGSILHTFCNRVNGMGNRGRPYSEVTRPRCVLYVHILSLLTKETLSCYHSSYRVQDIASSLLKANRNENEPAICTVQYLVEIYVAFL